MNNVKKIIESFNKKEDDFGFIPYELFEQDNLQDLFYFYPMIERLTRNILDKIDVFNIENLSSQTYKTFYSILQNNYEMNNYFDEEIMEYFEKIYCEDGLRNKMMHYNVNLNDHLSEFDVLEAKEIFLKLVVMFNKLDNSK